MKSCKCHAKIGFWSGLEPLKVLINLKGLWPRNKFEWKHNYSLIMYILNYTNITRFKVIKIAHWLWTSLSKKCWLLDKVNSSIAMLLKNVDLISKLTFDIYFTFHAIYKKKWRLNNDKDEIIHIQRNITILKA